MNPQRDWHSEYEQIGEKIDIGQPNPELQEGPVGPGRIAVYAVGAILILGIVFYGLNRPAQETAAVQQNTSSTASSTTGAAPQDKPQQPKADQSPQPNKPQGNAQPEKPQ